MLSTQTTTVSKPTGRKPISSADCQIAETILSQLGGLGRLTAMLGVRRVAPMDRGLVIRFAARARRRINSITVEFCRDDTYRVEFWSIRLPADPVRVSEYSGIYADSLRELIEGETGLALSLAPSIAPRGA